MRFREEEEEVLRGGGGARVVWLSLFVLRTVGRIAGGLGMESWVALRVWLVWRLVWLWRCVSFQPRKHTLEPPRFHTFLPFRDHVRDFLQALFKKGLFELF